MSGLVVLLLHYHLCWTLIYAKKVVVLIENNLTQKIAAKCCNIIKFTKVHINRTLKCIQYSLSVIPKKTVAVVGPFGNVAGQGLPIEFNTIPPTQSLVAAVVMKFGASSNNLGKFERFRKVEKV